MLKPEQLRSRTFKKSLGGSYSAAEIDAFFVEICDEYEKLYSENAELLTKLELFAERLAAYKKQEKQLKTAIANVKLLCDSLIDEANKKSQDIMTAAYTSRDEAIVELETAIKQKRGELEQLNDNIKEYKDAILFKYKVHYDSIIKLPGLDEIDTKQLLKSAEEKLQQAKDADSSIPVLMGLDEEKKEQEAVSEIISEPIKKPVEKTSTQTIEIQRREIVQDDDEIDAPSFFDKRAKKMSDATQTISFDESTKKDFVSSLKNAIVGKGESEETQEEFELHSNPIDVPDEPLEKIEFSKKDDVRFGTDFKLDDEDEKHKKGFFGLFK